MSTGFQFGLAKTTASSTGSTPGFSFGSSPFGIKPSLTIPTSTSVGPGHQSGIFSTNAAGSFSFGPTVTVPTTAPTPFGSPATSTVVSAPSLGLQTTKPFTFGSPLPTTFGTTTVSAGQPTFGSITQPNISLNLPPASTTSLSSPFSFNLPTSKPLTGFTLSSTATPATTGLSVGASITPSTTSSLFGNLAQPSSTILPSLSTSLTTTPSILQPKTQVSVPSSTPVAFGLGTKQPPSVATTLLPTTTSVTNVSVPFGLGMSTTTSTIPTASTAASKPVIGMGLGALGDSSSKATVSGTQVSTTTSIPSSFSSKITSVTTAATVCTSITGTTATSAVAPSTIAPKTSTMTYHKLEENINKWAHELEEQERYFLDEADRIVQWDQTLMSNGEKIATLYEKVELCKTEQTQLEQELDFIEGQQRELDSLLEPLERAATELPPGQLHSDFEREAVFQLASNIDLELGQMLSDLREMADQMNAGTAGSSSVSVTGAGGDVGNKAKLPHPSAYQSNAIQQVTRILNCHMHSLNWIHQNTQELTERVKLLDGS